MKKIIFLSILFVSLSYGSILVVKASHNIRYKAKIVQEDIILSYEDRLPLNCELISLDDLLSDKYRAKIYIKKNRIICKKDVYIPAKNKVIFDFGNIEIEKDGKVIKDTKQYVRIKNNDGTIEKIYKDGLSH